jgi:hypothetical protein
VFDIWYTEFTAVNSVHAAQRAAFVPPSGGISCAAAAALSYARRADFIELAEGMRLISAASAAELPLLPVWSFVHSLGYVKS